MTKAENESRFPWSLKTELVRNHIPPKSVIYSRTFNVSVCPLSFYPFTVRFPLIPVPSFFPHILLFFVFSPWNAIGLRPQHPPPHDIRISFFKVVSSELYQGSRVG
jgi:hypothetical protein